MSKLDKDLESYLRTNQRITKAKTRQQYRCVFRQLREATQIKKPEQITDDTIATFLDWCRSQEYRPHTINQKLAYLLAYATDRAKRGTIKIWPTIKRPPLPDIPPIALTLDELGALFRSARSQPGRIGEVDAGLWWGSLTEWFWTTSERTTATLTGVRLSNLTDRVILVPAEFRKGGRKSISYTLPPALIREMREVSPDGDQVWVWPWALADFYVRWRMVYESAGLTYTRYKTGPHQIRKTHATHLAAAGKDATASLGHSSSRVTKDHYIDTRIAKRPDFGAELPQV